MLASGKTFPIFKGEAMNKHYCLIVLAKKKRLIASGNANSRRKLSTAKVILSAAQLTSSLR